MSAVAFAVILSLANGCRKTQPNPASVSKTAKPAVRLYLVSTLAGALEPCGCSKDQLGGLDHLAAFVEKERQKADHHLLLAAGPLWFTDPKLKADHRTQDNWKADAISQSMKRMGLTAWAPGLNDWAAGDERFAELAKRSGATPLGVGYGKDGPLSSTTLFEAGGLKVGLIGLSQPKNKFGLTPKGLKLPSDELITKQTQEAERALRAKGARLVVAIAAMPRGAALRIVDRVPGLNVMLVGKPSSRGDANTEAPTPSFIGKTLVVETANHSQTAAVVDIHVSSQGKTPIVLSDAGGVQRAEKIAEISQRIRELEHRINGWATGGKVNQKDLQARRADLKHARAERAKLEQTTSTPKGDYFRYRTVEVREGLGKDKAVSETLTAYYKRVNEHNEKAFADRKPVPADKGQAHYVGMEECETCHLEAQEVWEKTGHAKAYKTLVDDHKQFNLDCVGCHVTGYGEPGGSTVTHNEALRDVQCETCHGPGSLHIKDPENKDLITLKPDPKSCVDQCHHPPHVEGFDPIAKMELILGPGHGK